MHETQISIQIILVNDIMQPSGGVDNDAMQPSGGLRLTSLMSSWTPPEPGTI